MQEIADSELLRQYADEGSETAFAALVTRHLNLVYAAAFRKTGNAHSAEEIAQAVFIILAKKAATLPAKTILPGWLYQTARLTAANFLRGEIRRSRREQEAYMQSLSNEPDLWPQIVPLLDDAMGRLNDKERNAIILRFFEGKSFQEIGAAGGGTENAAKKRVAYALEKLRKFFSKRGVISTAAIIAGAISTNSVMAAPPGLAAAISTVAVAKGAAASASTLTLVKGSLKLMAWTKTKIVVTGAVAALLVASAGVATIHAVRIARTAAALNRMQGSWEGSLDIRPEKLRIVLHLFKTNDTYQATLDSIDQGVMGVPIPTLAASGNSIDARMPALDADFQGALNADGSELSGTWKQLNKSYPATLKHTDTPDTVTTMTADQYAPRADSDLQGAWAGKLKVGNVSLELDLRVAETSPGTFQAVLDSPDQGVRNVPINSFTYQKPAVQFTMDAINGSYQGNLNAQDQVEGTWKQMGKKYPLTFHRAQAGAQPVAESAKDYGTGNPYQIQGHWKGALNVKGTQLHIVFNIAQMDDGTYSATLDSPDQGASGIPASEASFTSPDVRLTWKSIGGVFSGKLNDGKLTGTWHQGKGKGFPLELEKDKTASN